MVRPTAADRRPHACPRIDLPVAPRNLSAAPVPWPASPAALRNLPAMSAPFSVACTCPWPDFPVVLRDSPAPPVSVNVARVGAHTPSHDPSQRQLGPSPAQSHSFSGPTQVRLPE